MIYLKKGSLVSRGCFVLEEERLSKNSLINKCPGLGIFAKQAGIHHIQNPSRP